MKAIRSVATVFFLFVVALFASCGGGGGGAETQADKQFGLLQKTWSVVTVQDGTGTDVSTKWTGFQLTISGTKGQTPYSYSCTGRPALGPWPQGGTVGGLGTWVFGSDPTHTIVRDPNSADSLKMSYTYISSTNLTISFDYEGAGYARTSNVGGTWQFTFK